MYYSSDRLRLFNSLRFVGVRCIFGSSIAVIGVVLASGATGLSVCRIKGEDSTFRELNGTIPAVAKPLRIFDVDIACSRAAS